MKEELITFETAKLAKEKGFPQLNQGVYFAKEKEHCLVGWGFNDRTDNSLAQYSAPTQSLLQKWLREVHGIIVEITWQMCSTDYEYAIIDMNNPPKYEDEVERIMGFKTYEDTLEEGLYEGLKLIEGLK